MLTSLFGDLGPPKGSGTSQRYRHAEPASDVEAEADADADADAHPDAEFAATAIKDSVATEVNVRGQMVDRHSHDLFVTGSPAQAIREHFANTRADLQTATGLITLLDPAGVWAAAVIKALSDAGGRPIERLNLRERSTLRTLATIERTTLVHRQEETLRIYRADLRAAGTENAEIPVALMERSQLTAVIIGPLQPHAIDALLSSLQAAAQLATWRCPNLLFMVPPNAVWITRKISAVVWPSGLQVHVLSESMSGASSVWNALLSLWNQVKSGPGWDAAAKPSMTAAYPSPTASDAPRHPATQVSAPAWAGALPVTSPRGPHPELDTVRARRALGSLLALEGVLGGALVDGNSGLALALRTRADRSVNMKLAAAASAQVLRAHRQASRSLGMTDRIDEVTASAGPRQQVIRTLAQAPEVFLVAVLDKRRTNLALVRLHLMEIERSLA